MTKHPLAKRARDMADGWLRCPSGPGGWLTSPDLLRECADALDAMAEELAEARKYGAPKPGAKVLSYIKNPCTQHNHYWTTVTGTCMACSLDALAEENARLRGIIVMEHDDQRAPEGECYVREIHYRPCECDICKQHRAALSPGGKQETAR